MPEYRALRQQYGMLELCKTPDLAAQVTLQPVEAITGPTLCAVAVHFGGVRLIDNTVLLP